jgi:hypothetical protein
MQDVIRELNMMNYRTVLLRGALVLWLLLAAVVPLAAQDTTEPVTCDATLVTLTLLAVRDFGYQPPIRFDIYNYAQYRPLAEAVTGMALPQPQATLEPSAGEQARDAFNQAAAELQSQGLGLLGDGLAALSDEAGTIFDAGAAVLQQGQAALQAGADALNNTGDGTTLTYGSVPGQHEFCELLRVDVVDFLAAQLRQEYGVE